MLLYGYHLPRAILLEILATSLIGYHEHGTACYFITPLYRRTFTHEDGFTLLLIPPRATTFDEYDVTQAAVVTWRQDASHVYIVGWLMPLVRSTLSSHVHNVTSHIDVPSRYAALFAGPLPAVIVIAKAALTLLRLLWRLPSH